MTSVTLDFTHILCAHSLNARRWELATHDARMCRALSQRLQIPEVAARVMAARGLTCETAPDYLSPSLKAALPDPSHLLDMDIAAERIAAAVIAGERVAIFGDYDVDGATSCALLTRYLRALGLTPIIYIPDRMKEGYGPNTAALLSLKDRGASVVITVDCGTLAFEPIEAAYNAGLDIIVVDHHLGEAQKPKALAVVNPNRLDETSPHRNLAACGVAFLLIVAISRVLRKDGFFATRREPDLLSLLDIVALGTICDVVPLTGLNRALVAQGLKILFARQNIGIRVLMDVSRVDERPGVYHCGFMLGPRINAGGRVGSSDYGARLLSTDSESEAREIAQELERFNAERKALEAMALEEATLQAEQQHNRSVILVYSDQWHPGIIGIVAGRLKERFAKPAAVIAFDVNTGKASARSVSGFDFGSAVIAARQREIVLAGGGHAMAAGFSILRERVEELHAFLEQRAEVLSHLDKNPPLTIEACISVGGANVLLVKALEPLGPFGAGNREPRIMIERARVIDVAQTSGDHLRFTLICADGGPGRLTAMAFRVTGMPIEQHASTLKGKTVNIACTLRLREWQGRELVGVTIDDMAILA